MYVSIDVLEIVLKCTKPSQSKTIIQIWRYAGPVTLQILTSTTTVISLQMFKEPRAWMTHTRMTCTWVWKESCTKQKLPLTRWGLDTVLGNILHCRQEVLLPFTADKFQLKFSIFNHSIFWQVVHVLHENERKVQQRQHLIEDLRHQTGTLVEGHPSLLTANISLT